MNNTIYYCVLTHGLVPGKYNGIDFIPETFVLPKQVKYFNKQTKVVPGINNICFYGTSNYFDYYLPLIELLKNKDMTGRELSKHLMRFKSAEDKYSVKKGKSTSIEKSINEVLKNKIISFPSIDNKLNNEFINKIFTTNDTKNFQDIFVVKQSGGDLMDGEPIIELYFKKDVVSLKQLINFSINKGYYNIIIVDLSCESLYDLKTKEFINIQSKQSKQFRNTTKDKYWGGRLNRV
jgi:hypothetical protein